MTDFTRYCPTCKTGQPVAGHRRGQFATCPTCYGRLPPAEGEVEVPAVVPRVAPIASPVANGPMVIRDAEPVEDDPPRRSPVELDVEPVEDEPPRRRIFDDEPDRPQPKADARELSLPWNDLPSDIKDRLDRELYERERVVWIGRPDQKLRRLRRLPTLAIGAFFFTVGLILFILAVAAGHPTFFAAVPAGVIGGILLLVSGISMLIPSSAFYVLTSRRAITLTRGLFGLVLMEFGPERAAYPRIRRNWFASDGGDLIMRTMVFVTYTGRGASYHTQHFGFMDVRRLGEIDALCGQTLGSPYGNPPGSRSALGVLQIIGYVFTGILLVGFIAALTACVWASYLAPPPPPINPNAPPPPNNPNPAPKKKKRAEAPAVPNTTEQLT